MSAAPEPPPPTLRGLVLAGGRSERMGTDKATLVYRDDLPQVEAAARLLDPRCVTVHLSTRAGQSVPAAAAHRPQLVDRHPQPGPLAGILTAFDFDPAAAWLIVACDLPLLDGDTLDRLLAARAPAAPATAYASADAGLPEPLCAIYEPAFRPVLASAAEAGRTCPRGIMKHNPVKLIPLARPAALDNANDPTEAARLSALLRTKHITVQYFGALRAQAGCDGERCATTAATCAELFAELAARHHFTLPAAACRPAVNHQVARADSPVTDGDTVVFLPPVAGG